MCGFDPRYLWIYLNNIFIDKQKNIQLQHFNINKNLKHSSVFHKNIFFFKKKNLNFTNKKHKPYKLLNNFFLRKKATYSINIRGLLFPIHDYEPPGLTYCDESFMLPPNIPPFTRITLGVITAFYCNAIVRALPT